MSGKKTAYIPPPPRRTVQKQIDNHKRAIAGAVSTARSLHAEAQSSRWMSAEEKQQVAKIVQNLSTMSVPNNASGAERANAAAAEQVRAIDVALAPARFREAQSQRLQRIQGRAFGLTQRSELSAARKDIDTRLATLESGLASLHSGSREARAWHKTSEAVDDAIGQYEVTIRSLNRAEHFLDNASQQPWSRQDKIVRWRSELSTNAAGGPSAVETIVGAMYADIAALQESAERDWAAHEREKARLAEEATQQLIRDANGAEMQIFADGNLSNATAEVLAASADINALRRCVSKGDIEGATAILHRVRGALDGIRAAAVRGEIERARHQQEATELAAELISLVGDDALTPAQRQNYLERVDVLRNHDQAGMRREAGLLRGEIAQRAEAAENGARIALYKERLLNCGVDWNSDALAAINALGMGSDIAVEGVADGSPIQLTLRIGADSSLMFDTNNLEHDSCRAIDNLVASLAHDVGEEGVRYADENGARAIPRTIGSEHQPVASEGAGLAARQRNTRSIDEAE